MLLVILPPNIIRNETTVNFLLHKPENFMQSRIIQQRPFQDVNCSFREFSLKFITVWLFLSYHKRVDCDTCQRGCETLPYPGKSLSEKLCKEKFNFIAFAFSFCLEDGRTKFIRSKIPFTEMRSW